VILLGAPESVVVDAAAHDPDVDRLLDAMGLPVVPADAHVTTLGRPSVGLFGTDHPPVAGCHAWYVGSGPCPAWMHPAAGKGALALALLGTGLAQERAGAAFRAAGAGEAVPASSAYDASAVLAGITAAVAPDPPVLRSPEIGTADRDDLLRVSFEALDRCCAPGGAILAAPPRTSPTEPDYGFFWQRDAAAVATALHGLALHGADAEVRDRARSRLDGYVGFVAELGPRLAASASVAGSRCTATGEPVEGYGNPQQDGPAATALVLLAVVEDPARALALARPFLDHLLVGDPVGYDLWELVRGRCFHATNLCRRALSRAADRAELVDDPAAGRYAQEAARLAEQVAAFLDPVSGCYRASQEASPRWFRALSGLDMGAIGSDLLTADGPGEGLDLGATLHALEQAFSDRWPVNEAWRRAGHLGLGMGRFPEDCNDGLGSTGGSPWPVTTLWAAQWHFLHGDRGVGQGHLDFVLAHVDPAELPEQIDGFTGRPRGARSLAWAHAELVTTLLVRDGL